MKITVWNSSLPTPDPKRAAITWIAARSEIALNQALRQALRCSAYARRAARCSLSRSAAPGVASLTARLAR